jgi:Carboxypeptidase regulatory-like domain
MKHVSFIAAVLLLFTLHLPGQTPTGTVQGVVTDPSGATVAGAKVSVVNIGTNETKDLTTDSSGHYVVPFLTPGTYDVSIGAAGFNGAKEANVKIDVSQNREINFTLKVGAISEQVEVQAAAATLETQSATTGQVIDSKKVIDLPLNGRNPFSLATLVPGVSNVGNASTPHIGGSRNAVNEESLDGMTNILPENNVGNNLAAYTPIVDSVQEFSVQTNSLSAEYGRFGGGVINVVTKSGTNTWHGGLFEFQRHSALNANDFFANRNGKAKPDSKEQQYGGTLGGPIQIPKIYDGHNKTFFFFGFQGDNRTAAATTTDTVPTAQALSGNFNGIANIYDPLSLLTTNAAGQFVRAQFAGNQIPASRFDPVAVKAASYWPAPNAGAAGAQTNNFIAVGASANNDYKWDARLDHNFTPNWHMFFRLSHDWNNSTPLYDYGPTNPASQGGNGPNAGGAYSVSMDHTITFSPTLVADFRYGFARSYSLRTPLGQGFLPSSLGLPTSLDAVGATRA